jgi:aryl-alcohol dehydrogenase-like predicted oxidoreductase
MTTTVDRRYSAGPRRQRVRLDRQRDEGRAVLDAFYEAGGRMIDTADVYSAWIPGHVGGESESFIGEWLESRGVRRTCASIPRPGC